MAEVPPRVPPAAPTHCRILRGTESTAVQVVTPYKHLAYKHTGWRAPTALSKHTGLGLAVLSMRI